jgi:hypothetical protein
MYCFDGTKSLPKAQVWIGNLKEMSEPHDWALPCFFPEHTRQGYTMYHAKVWVSATTTRLLLPLFWRHVRRVILPSLSKASACIYRWDWSLITGLVAIRSGIVHCHHSLRLEEASRTMYVDTHYADMNKSMDIFMDLTDMKIISCSWNFLNTRAEHGSAL